MSKYKTVWEELGDRWVNGERISEITIKGKLYKFEYTDEEFRLIARGSERGGLSPWPEEFIEEQLKLYKPTQGQFISDLHSDYCLASGGFGSGKSLSLYIKLILFAMCFPENRILLGRKTLADIDRAVLPDLFELMPPSWYTHRVKDGTINFKNGSQIILFGLDSMQSGSVTDIKKSQQKIKSLNLGAYFIDQLEEVEYPVFEVLNSRLRRTNVPIRQGNMTTNPANFWAYHQFVEGKSFDGEEWIEDSDSTSTLYQSSMLFNPQLPWDYIRKQLARGDAYVERFVKGNWNTDVLIQGAVFAKEHMRYLETLIKQPESQEEGCNIWEQPKPGEEYQMGVDPSEGVVDPSSVTVVSKSGKKVAGFNGKVPINGLADKVKFLYYKYKKPLIIPERNSAGAALLREIRDLRIYRQKHLDYKTDKETNKLGFRTSHDTKAQLIQHFQSLLRKKAVKIFDRKTLQEMYAFVWSDEARQQGAGASSGFHDDDVMSAMLAYWEWSPEKTEELQVVRTRPKRKKRTFQYT